MSGVCHCNKPENSCQGLKSTTGGFPREVDPLQGKENIYVSIFKPSLVLRQAQQLGIQRHLKPSRASPLLWWLVVDEKLVQLLHGTKKISGDSWIQLK